jgi:hypothetical protein
MAYVVVRPAYDDLCRSKHTVGWIQNKTKRNKYTIDSRIQEITKSTAWRRSVTAEPFLTSALSGSEYRHYQRSVNCTLSQGWSGSVCGSADQSSHERNAVQSTAEERADSTTSLMKLLVGLRFKAACQVTNSLSLGRCRADLALNICSLQYPIRLSDAVCWHYHSILKL